MALLERGKSNYPDGTSISFSFRCHIVDNSLLLIYDGNVRDSYKDKLAQFGLSCEIRRFNCFFPAIFSSGLVWGINRNSGLIQSKRSTLHFSPGCVFIAELRIASSEHYCLLEIWMCLADHTALGGIARSVRMNKLVYSTTRLDKSHVLINSNHETTKSTGPGLFSKVLLVHS